MWQVNILNQANTKFVQCSVRGRSHEKHDLPCQDKTFALFSEETAYIALADGAGSRELPDIGAEAVTRELSRDFTANFDRYFSDDIASVRQKLIERLSDIILRLSSDYGREPGCFASTLLIAAAKGNRFIHLHIGDGLICAMQNGKMRTVSLPENGESSSATYFTTSQNLEVHMRIGRFTAENCGGLVLMSDGASDCLYNDEKFEISPAIGRIMTLLETESAEDVSQWLRDDFENVVKPATTDDCSIAMLRILSDTENEYWWEYAFPGSSESRRRRLIKKYYTILVNISGRETCRSLARRFCLRPKYMKKSLDYLVGQGLIDFDGMYYQAKQTDDYDDTDYYDDSDDSVELEDTGSLDS